MPRNNQEGKQNEDDYGPIQSDLAVNAPDTAEKRAEQSDQHQNIPEDAFSSGGHGVFQDTLLIHKQEEGKIGQGQQGHAEDRCGRGDRH